MHGYEEVADAAGFARILNDSGLSSREIEAILMVGQSTVSRLKRGLIADVSRHVRIFAMHHAPRRSTDIDQVMKDLAVRARQDPAFGKLLMQLHQFMHNA